MTDITTREQKIINDILFHLDGWRVNDIPKETRKIQSFLDDNDPQYDNSIRKEVSSRDVLSSYDLARVHALNYIKRKEFPNNPSIYQAICYWAAGLLSEQSRFKEENIDKSTLLIEEARRLLSPYVKKNNDFFLVSGDEFFWEEFMRSERSCRPRRNRQPYKECECDEPKEPLIHGHFHDDYIHYRPYFHKDKPCCKPPKPPVSEALWINNKYKNKYKIKADPITSEDGITANIHAELTKNGQPCIRGKVLFYVYV